MDPTAQDLPPAERFAAAQHTDGSTTPEGMTPPEGTMPDGARPDGARPDGARPDGAQQELTGAMTGFSSRSDHLPALCAPKPALALGPGVGTPIFDELFARFAAGEFAPAPPPPSPLRMPLQSRTRRIDVDMWDATRTDDPSLRPKDIFATIGRVLFRRENSHIIFILPAVIHVGDDVLTWEETHTVPAAAVPMSAVTFHTVNSGSVLPAAFARDPNASAADEALRRLLLGLVGAADNMIAGWVRRGHRPHIRLQNPTHPRSAGPGIVIAAGPHGQYLHQQHWPDRVADRLWDELHAHGDRLRVGSVPAGWEGLFSHVDADYLPQEFYPARPEPVVIATDASWNTATHFAGTAWVSSDGKFASSTGKFTTIVEAEKHPVMQAISVAGQRYPDRQVTILTDNRMVARQIRNLPQEHPFIRVRWVRGHAGHPLNEAAHRFAMARRRDTEFQVSEEVWEKQCANILADAMREWREYRRTYPQRWW